MKKMPAKLQKWLDSFNLGAFFVPVIFNLVYGKYWITILFAVLTIFPYAASRTIPSVIYTKLVFFANLLGFLLALYSGVTGNRTARAARKYLNEDDFRQCQLYWLPLVILSLVIHVSILPIRATGYYNTAKMIKIAESKHVLKQALRQIQERGEILGEDITDEETAYYIAQNVFGKFDGKNKITMADGTTFTIIGYPNECGIVRENHYVGEQTACAKAIVNFNGVKEPDKEREGYNLAHIRSLFNRSLRLGNVYEFYIYQDDALPGEETIEQYALKRFERI